MWKTIALATLTLIGAAACKSESGGSGGGGGNGGGGTSTGSGSTQTGTCASTCKKSIDLNCAEGVHDQAECEASCESQQAACSGQAAQFQAYLDCIESTPMECGSATMSPSSPDCVAQGLAIFQCASMGATTGSGGGGGG